MTNSKYWDIYKTKSHNCLFNFIISLRGGGKTYGCIDYVINNYIKGKQLGVRKEFVYVRRQENELKKLTTSRGGRFFKAVESKYPQYKFKAEANEMYIDGDNFGHAIQLSTARINKSDVFPYVDTIIFDEFIVKRGRSHYLPDEVTAFLELYETIARPGTDHCPVTVFFLGNAVTQTNPYFDYFGIDKPSQGEFRKFGASKDILVQDVDVPQLQEDKHNSRFGKLIEGTNYSSYAIDNEWLEDNTDFIKHKTANSECRMCIRYMGTWLGIWYDDIECTYYISLNVDLQVPNKYSATTDDHQPNIMMLKTCKQMNSYKHLITAYTYGNVRYESIKLKNWFRDIMRMMNAV